jgi:hypothetical protein
MKKLILVLFICTLCFGATNDIAYNKAKNPGESEIQGLATSVTTQSSGGTETMLVGDLFGFAYTVGVIYTGTDADGFTITVSNMPKTIGDLVFPSTISKFTKLFTATGQEFAFETVSINANVAMGAIFLGPVYVTVTDFEGTKLWTIISVERGLKIGAY